MTEEGTTTNTVIAGEMDQLQARLKAEQNTTRKVMLTFISVFVFALLVILALFLYAGIHILRNSQSAVNMISEVRSAVAANAFEISGLSNRVTSISGVQMRLSATASAEADTRGEGDESLRSELRRINKWVSVKEANEERLVQKQQDWINALDVTVDDLDKQVASMAVQFEEWVASGQVITDAAVSLQAATQKEQATGDGEVQPTLLAAEPLTIDQVDALFEQEDERMADPIVPERSSPADIRVITLPNGDRYEGEFVSGLMEGWGTYHHSNGDTYEGQFAVDMKHGLGTLTTSLGEQYDGGFREGMKHGRGRFLMVDGSRYIGDFLNDIIAGEGVMFYADGSRYAGGFMNGLKHGQGVLRFHNGDLYQGDFLKGYRTGRGVYTFADGGRYVGQFVKGRREGQGHYVYPGGEEYLGPFRKGKKHGLGIRIYADGTRIRGVWNEGTFVRNVKR